MAAFDRVKSGFPQMDELLDNIRLGDNVVWQVTDLEQFRMFARALVRQAVKDKRDICYIRFASHEPILDNTEGVDVKRFDPDLGFEAFTVAVREEITRRGKEAFYVFDCLSSLQSVWYTDLMMGNFFRVTCPYLFELDTVAYFPVMRGRHSYDAVAKIRDTTQLLLEVFSNDEYVYLHPLKVWNRYSDTMFSTHGYEIKTGEFKTIRDSLEMSRYFRTLDELNKKAPDQTYDSYDRFFNEAKEAYAKGNFSKETEEMIISSTMTKDPHLARLVKKYFAPEDYFTLRSRMIGSGAIGGKACGMLLSRKICMAEIEEFPALSEPHDSFYIGSDVFYTYIVHNDAWITRISQRKPENYFSAAGALRKSLLEGSFPGSIQEQFRKVTDYFGTSPYIVRSSSFLEDGFGNAFAGKYESVFCVNQGTPDERLTEFENAVRRVYASTMNKDALEYRKSRGLDKKDEQMAVLVQRVSGSFFGPVFMPCAAGVGYSKSAYKWQSDMDSDAGMLRLVIGLGTKAVDRTGRDYPRLSNLDRPALRMYQTDELRHRYSQRYLDVLDITANAQSEVRLTELVPTLPEWYKKAFLSRDTDAERNLFSKGERRRVYYASCQGLLENRAFTSLMQKSLKTLEKVYENPVDIEYTVNMNAAGNFNVNLLQCRPLYQAKPEAMIDFESLRLSETLFWLKDSSMGPSGAYKTDIVVKIDPEAYFKYPYAKKCDVAAAVGKINEYLKGSGKNPMLLSPGRIGTSSPELGVPVKFGEISAFKCICEVACKGYGYNPELSYGSHMFQDLVEAGICYVAVFGNEKTLSYSPELLDGFNNISEKILGSANPLLGMIQIFETPDLTLYLGGEGENAACGF